MKTTGEHKRTPVKLYGWANKRWGPFGLDPAADRHNSKCKRFFTAKQNGLKQKWRGRVWLNPPWDDIEPWVRKAYDAVFLDKTATLVCMLLPTRTGQPWYQDWIKPYAETKKDIRGPGRVKFGTRSRAKKGGGGFEDCAFYVFERPLRAVDFND